MILNDLFLWPPISIIDPNIFIFTSLCVHVCTCVHNKEEKGKGREGKSGYFFFKIT